MNYSLEAVPWALKTQTDVAGILVRAGYSPAGAAKVAGLPEMEHTGLPPVTVQGEDKPTAPFGSQPKPEDEPEEVPA